MGRDIDIGFPTDAFASQGTTPAAVDAVIDDEAIVALHVIPTADIATNVNIRDVVGNKSDTAIATVGTTKSLMAYIKALVNKFSTAAMVLKKTLSVANDTVAEGFYEATTLSAVDTDLVTGNIKAGITIFGIAGKTEVVDTTEVASPAAAADIVTDKIAFVNGVKITGTHV